MSNKMKKTIQVILVILGVLLVVVPLTLMAIESDKQYKERQQHIWNAPNKYSLQQIKLMDNEETHGSFGFLILAGGGSIEEKMESYYYFYWEAEPGVYQFDKIPTSQARVTQDEPLSPYLVMNDTLKELLYNQNEMSIGGALDYNTFSAHKARVTFHVPPGSIESLVEVDIESLTN